MQIVDKVIYLRRISFLCVWPLFGRKSEYYRIVHYFLKKLLFLGYNSALLFSKQIFAYLAKHNGTNDITNTAPATTNEKKHENGHNHRPELRC